MILKNKFNYYQIYKIFFLLFLTNISNLYSHNLVNGGCKVHCAHKIKSINKNKKINIQSIKVEHGRVNSNCFIIDKKLAYISDVSKIFEKDLLIIFNLLFWLIIIPLFSKNFSYFLKLSKVFFLSSKSLSKKVLLEEIK